MTALLTLYFWSVNRIAGFLMGLYTILILIASVYLGWHYAIDGYAAIVIVGIIWRASKPLAEIRAPEHS